MQTFEWSTSPVGPVAGWPSSLRMAVSLCLNSQFPTVIFWGPDLMMLYNDAYLPMLADKHPASLGRPAREVWPEIWEIIGPMLHSVLETGQATWSYDLFLPIIHEGTVGEYYFTFSYSPIYDEGGTVRGVFCPVTETTERIVGARRQEALRKEAEAARDQVTQTLESITDAFFTLDPQWRITYANHRATALWGRQDDLIGKHIWHEFPESESLIFGEQLRKAMAEQVTVDFEGWYPPWRAWLAMRAYPSPEGLAVYFQDITARKRAEEASLRLAAIVESSDDAIISKSLDGIITSWNAAAERIFGYRAEEMIGQPILRLIPEDRHEEEPRILERLRRGERVDHFETIRRTKDGRLLDVSVTISPLRDERGTIIGASKIARDITERKRTEEALRRSEQELADFFENATVGLHWVGPDGTILRVNQAELELLGYTREEYLGHHIAEFHADPAVITDILQRLRRGETLKDYEAQMRRKDGVLRSVRIDSSILRHEGHFIHTRCFTRDITEQKQLEQALARRAAELERLNGELQQFGYVVSHDLQEPLRTITNFVQLLAQHLGGRVDEKAAEFIKFTVEGAQRMQALITDLLAYTRVSGHSQPFAAVDCEGVLARVLGDLQLVIRESAAEVTHDPLPVVHGDAGQLGLVLQNLIGNALKFRGQAPPRVHVGARREGAQWVVWVRDNGIGIEPRDKERIFQVFQRLHPRSEYPGTGIGLAICQKIIERHGGRIWVESEQGKGATFFFTLPPPGAPTLDGRTLLVKETREPEPER
jgi:PAS domain S-box-containing protein